jgi:RHS repeat-associated protein
VRRTTSTSVTGSIYDGDHLFLELDGNGALIAEYAYYPGLDRPHSVLRGSNSYYFTFDATGNVKGLLDGSTLVAQYQYSPFGSVVSSSGPSLAPFRFKGSEYDEETGLYYVRARYYDPALTRFVSEDPLGIAAGVNPYLFGANDPINHSDPFGLDFWVDGNGCPDGYDVVKQALVNSEVDSTLCAPGAGLRSGTNPHPSDRGGVGPLLFHGGIGGGAGIWGEGSYTAGFYFTLGGDFGIYRRWELGLGIEKPGFSLELGVSRPGIFDGQSYAACGGFVHGGCKAWNSSGWAPSYVFGITGGHLTTGETTRTSVRQIIETEFIGPFLRFVTPDATSRTWMGRPF